MIVNRDNICKICRYIKSISTKSNVFDVFVKVLEDKTLNLVINVSMKHG